MFWYQCGMVLAAVDVRSVAQLRELSDAGEQPKYLLFWGIVRRQPVVWGKAA